MVTKIGQGSIGRLGDTRGTYIQPVKNDMDDR